MSVDYMVQGLHPQRGWEKVYPRCHKGRAEGFVDALLRVSPRPAIRILKLRDGQPAGTGPIAHYPAQPVRRKAGGASFDDAGDLLEHLLGHQNYYEKMAELERREAALLAGEARYDEALKLFGDVK